MIRRSSSFRRLVTALSLIAMLALGMHGASCAHADGLDVATGSSSVIASAGSVVDTHGHPMAAHHCDLCASAAVAPQPPAMTGTAPSTGAATVTMARVDRCGLGPDGLRRPPRTV